MRTQYTKNFPVYFNHSESVSVSLFSMGKDFLQIAYGYKLSNGAVYKVEAEVTASMETLASVGMAKSPPKWEYYEDL